MNRQWLFAIAGITACAHPSPASPPAGGTSRRPTPPSLSRAIQKITVRTHCSDGRSVMGDGVCKKPKHYWETVCRTERACATLCTIGDARGCRRASELVKPTGAHRERRRAYSERQCALGDRFGCRRMAAVAKAQARAESEGPAKQRAEAEEQRWLARSCQELEDGTSCAALAFALRDDDKTATFHWAQRACSLGNELGCLFTARAWMDGHGTGIDRRSGMHLLEERCRVGTRQAYAAIGRPGVAQWLCDEARARRASAHWPGENVASRGERRGPREATDRSSSQPTGKELGQRVHER